MTQLGFSWFIGFPLSYMWCAFPFYRSLYIAKFFYIHALRLAWHILGDIPVHLQTLGGILGLLPPPKLPCSMGPSFKPAGGPMVALHVLPLESCTWKTKAPSLCRSSSFFDTIHHLPPATSAAFPCAPSWSNLRAFADGAFTSREPSRDHVGSVEGSYKVST